jgi:hypothetical protein
MTPQVYLAFLVWIPFIFYLFQHHPARRVLVISFIAAWLFLPEARIPLPGIPDLTKMSVTCYGILLATFIFDVGHLKSYKFGWLDIPMLIWCVCPFVTSVVNGLGPYDGFASALDQTVTWGLPFFLGRIYLNSFSAMRELAIGIVIGGLIYVPLCLFEARMSPQLHRMVYGFANFDFLQSIRYGGYRPTVFMAHGLMVGAWMMAAALISLWLWKTKVIAKVWKLPMSWVVALLFATVIIVKATGAWMLLIYGIITLFIAKWFRTAFLVPLISLGIVIYLYCAATGIYLGDQVVTFMINNGFPRERIESYEFRVRNEKILAEKAQQQMIFGWGGYGRSRIFNEYGRDISVTDSLWIIAYGVYGMVGLWSITGSLLLPSLAFMRRYPARLWGSPNVAPAAAVAVLVVLYMLDCVLNAMTNPVYALCSGGLAGVVLDQSATSHKGIMRLSPTAHPQALIKQRRQHKIRQSKG